MNSRVRSLRGPFVSTFVMLLLTLPLTAAVFEIPSDRQLVEQADLIAIATPIDSIVERGADGSVHTVTTLRIDKRIAGESESTIRVTERGGWLDGRGTIFSGAPRFENGRRVLLFLRRDDTGEYHTWGMALGKFDYVDHEGRTVLVRGLDAGHLCAITPEGVSHSDAVRSMRFVDWAREISMRGESKIEYETSLELETVLAEERGVTPSTSHRADYLLTGGPQGGPVYPLRWILFDSGGSIQFHANGTQTGISGLSGSQNAAAAWSGAGTDVTASVSGSCTICERQPTDNTEMAIILGGDPQYVSGSVGETFVAAATFYASISSYSLDGETFYPLDHADIIVSSSFSGPQALFDAIVTHEIGHTIGFRHSNQGTPSSSSAIMNSSVSAIGAVLQAWDLDAVQTVYGTGPVCRPATVTGQSPDKTIGYMQSTALSITISGDATSPSYQWYTGSSNDFSQASPISGATAASINTGPLTSGVHYFWGKVSNECSQDVSDPIKVTVGACQQPTIVTEPADVEITAGDSTTLLVTADGSSPLSFQWYRGEKGNTASPIIGANSVNYNTGPLSATSKFWVQVTNPCGAANSRTVTVTVSGGCELPTIVSHPMSQSVSEGAQVTLMVSASSPNSALSYEWFKIIDGEPVSVSTGSASYTTGPITTTSEYFVEVTDSCGTVVSNIATIELLGCQPPKVIGITPNSEVRYGAQVNLSVTASGNKPFTFQWYRGLSGDESDAIEDGTSRNYLTPPLNETSYFWVRITNECRSTDSKTVVITPVCRAPSPPSIGVVPIEVLSHAPFTVSWESQPGVTTFELEEATSPDFSGGRTFTVTGLSRQFVRAFEVPTRLHYRVRGISECDGGIGGYSPPIAVSIIPLPPPRSTDFDLSVAEGATAPIIFEAFIEGIGTPVGFTITTTVDWISVSPSSGTLPADGMTVTVTADPTKMRFGSNTGTFTVVFASSGKTASDMNSTVPITVSLVSPASTDSKSQPSEASVIIPGVAHASGFNSQWQSDVRLLNVGTSPAPLSLKYIPAGVNGFQNVKATSITLQPGVTTAFNDISKNWYGIGSTGDSEVGSLEVRPGSTSLATIASSRTFNKSTSGTYGQFIPPIPYFRFIGRGQPGSPTPRLSMQQISQSARFRTNVSILEAAGQTTEVTLSVFDSSGNLIREFPYTLGPGEQKTLNSLLAENQITLDDGRLELVVTSGGGRVHAYSSVVDNRTNDPFLVPAVDVSTVSATRWVLPGVADYQTGQASWRSDVRIFNGGDSAVDATLTFYPQGVGATPVSVDVTIQPGRVTALDNILRQTFDQENIGGALHITTDSPAKLVATGRTYDQQESGTYGQFIPAATPDAGFSRQTRAAYVLQLEESERFRSNLGIAEITGNPVLMKITASVPGLIAAPSIQLGLQPYEFTQLNRVLTSFLGTGTAFNGSVTVEVIGGEGRIVTYGSVVDNVTQDPTYVPGQ